MTPIEIEKRKIFQCVGCGKFYFLINENKNTIKGWVCVCGSDKIRFFENEKEKSDK